MPSRITLPTAPLPPDQHHSRCISCLETKSKEFGFSSSPLQFIGRMYFYNWVFGRPFWNCAIKMASCFAVTNSMKITAKISCFFSHLYKIPLCVFSNLTTCSTFCNYPKKIFQVFHIQNGNVLVFSSLSNQWHMFYCNVLFLRIPDIY